MTQKPSHSFSALPDALVAQLIEELDDVSVRAIILRGSYARGEATPPYSDVDLTRIIQEEAGDAQPKYYIWRHGYLISVSTYSYSAYRQRFLKPEEAIFTVTGVQEARILLDKDGAFQAFQQEAKAFRWEPLQAAANTYASHLMMELSEIILRTLRVLQGNDPVLLAKVVIDLVSDITRAVAVQRGLLLIGHSYFQQVQEAMGRNSDWTRYHTRAAGSDLITTLRERGVAALRLYQETYHILQPAISAEHREVIEPLIDLIDQTLIREKVL